MVTTEGGRKAVNVDQAGLLLGLGRSLTWRLAWEKKLRTVRAGHRVLVPLSAIDEFLAGQQDETE